MHTPNTLETGKRYKIPHPTRDFEFIEVPIVEIEDGDGSRLVVVPWPDERSHMSMDIEEFCAQVNLTEALMPQERQMAFET